MKGKLIWLAAAAVLVAAIAMLLWPSEKPSFMVVVIDTLREDLAGEEPRFLLELKSRGLYFENCFTTTPVTLPAHLSLFASRLPNELGVLTNGVVYRRGCSKMLPALLKKKGYYTFAVVSLGTLSSYYGLAACFDFYEDSFPASRWYRTAEEVNRAVLENLHRIKKPFFMFIHYCEPHEPYVPPYLPPDASVFIDGEKVAEINFLKMEKHDFRSFCKGSNALLKVKLRRREGVRRYFLLFGEKRVEVTGSELELELPCGQLVFKTEVRLTPQLARRYYREELLYWDEQFRKLYRELEKRGFLENTYLFILSDHGEGLGEWRNHIGHIHFLNGVYTRIPLLLLGEGIKPGVDSELRSIMDVYPTVLALAGIKADDGIKGRSLLSRGGHTRLFLQTHRPEAYYDRYSIVKPPFQLINTPRKRRLYLFDLTQDRLSLHPIENPEVQKKLLSELLMFQQLVARTARSRVLDRKSKEILRSLGYLH